MTSNDVAESGLVLSNVFKGKFEPGTKSLKLSVIHLPSS
jgi:hypothetical protein